ncbi:MAG: hypothetical protein WCB85_04480 [Candidatus Dormiibacterota bacterium]
MRPRRLALAGLALVLLGTSACGVPVAAPAPASASSPSCSQERGFSVSLAVDTGGQASPLAAAQWFAVHGGVWSNVPRTGWRVVGHDSQGTVVQSGSMKLRVFQGSDGTWFVVSGSEPSC